MYPDADVSEWRYKGANKERSLRVLSLINPSVEGKDVWQKYDDIYDDDDDDKCGECNIDCNTFNTCKFILISTQYFLKFLDEFKRFSACLSVWY